MKLNPLEKFSWRKACASAASICAITAVMIAAIVVLPSCGGGSTGVATITAISITPTSNSVGINTQSDFTANVTLSNGTTASTTSASTAVTWEVNCITGGNSSVGTIVSSPSDNQVGIYTAPGVVPATNNGQVSITASAAVTNATSTTCTSTGILYSNAATATITVQLGVNITPTTTPVEAGGSFQFTALQNNLPDNNAVWTVSSANGGNIGTIDSTGLYTAPLYPPPGQVVTITATDGASVATATATINYSDASLTGPFAFSYAGGSGSGFMATAGSFVSDGRGDIVSGVEDVTSPLTGTSIQIPIYSGNYVVKPDGRVNAVINTARQTGLTWQFALTTDQHALMILFNQNATGSGTIEQQNLNDLTASDSIFTSSCNSAQCPYVFRTAGIDSAFSPLALAGYFNVNGSGGIPQAGTALDVNDNGAVATTFSDLQGSYAFDTAYNGSGRGTITLTSAATNHQYAFYVIDATRVKLVEIDSTGFLAGDMLSAPTGAFTVAELPAANYAFISSGNSSTGGYAAGGIFTSDGGGNVSAGAIDTNNAGTVTANTSLTSCAYTVDSGTGRIDLKLCSSGATSEFGAYPTAAGNFVIIETDAAATSSGIVRPQSILPTAAPVQAPLAGTFAFDFGGEGVAQGQNGAPPQDMVGAAAISASISSTGHLDINNFNAVYPADVVNATSSSISTPSTLGRGTVVIAGSDPAVSYSFVYYIVDNNTTLVLDQDTVRVGTGAIVRQF